MLIMANEMSTENTIEAEDEPEEGEIQDDGSLEDVSSAEEIAPSITRKYKPYEDYRLSCKNTYNFGPYSTRSRRRNVPVFCKNKSRFHNPSTTEDKIPQYANKDPKSGSFNRPVRLKSLSNPSDHDTASRYEDLLLCYRTTKGDFKAQDTAQEKENRQDSHEVLDVKKKCRKKRRHSLLQSPETKHISSSDTDAEVEVDKKVKKTAANHKKLRVDALKIQKTLRVDDLKTQKTLRVDDSKTQKTLRVDDSKTQKTLRVDDSKTPKMGVDDSKMQKTSKNVHNEKKSGKVTKEKHHRASKKKTPKSVVKKRSVHVPVKEKVKKKIPSIVDFDSMHENSLKKRLEAMLTVAQSLHLSPRGKENCDQLHTFSSVTTDESKSDNLDCLAQKDDTNIAKEDEMSDIEILEVPKVVIEPEVITLDDSDGDLYIESVSSNKIESVVDSQDLASEEHAGAKEGNGEDGDEDLLELRRLALESNKHKEDLLELHCTAMEPKKPQEVENREEPRIEIDEVLQLRLNALRSAYLKKHMERKQRGLTLRHKSTTIPSPDDSFILSPLNSPNGSTNLQCSQEIIEVPGTSTDCIVATEPIVVTTPPTFSPASLPIIPPSSPPLFPPITVIIPVSPSHSVVTHPTFASPRIYTPSVVPEISLIPSHSYSFSSPFPNVIPGTHTATTPLVSPLLATIPTPPPPLVLISTPPLSPALISTPPLSPALISTPPLSPALVSTPPPPPAIISTPPPPPDIISTPPPPPDIISIPPPPPDIISTPPPPPDIISTPPPPPDLISNPPPPPDLISTPPPPPALHHSPPLTVSPAPPLAAILAPPLLSIHDPPPPPGVLVCPPPLDLPPPPPLDHAPPLPPTLAPSPPPAHSTQSPSQVPSVEQDAEADETTAIIDMDLAHTDDEMSRDSIPILNEFIVISDTETHEKESLPFDRGDVCMSTTYEDVVSCSEQVGVEGTRSMATTSQTVENTWNPIPNEYEYSEASSYAVAEFNQYSQQYKNINVGGCLSRQSTNTTRTASLGFTHDYFRHHSNCPPPQESEDIPIHELTVPDSSTVPYTNSYFISTSDYGTEPLIERGLQLSDSSDITVSNVHISRSTTKPGIHVPWKNPTTGPNFCSTTNLQNVFPNEVTDNADHSKHLDTQLGQSLHSLSDTSKFIPTKQHSVHRSQLLDGISMDSLSNSSTAPCIEPYSTFTSESIVKSVEHTLDISEPHLNTISSVSRTTVHQAVCPSWKKTNQRPNLRKIPLHCQENICDTVNQDMLSSELGLWRSDSGLAAVESRPDLGEESDSKLVVDNDENHIEPEAIDLSSMIVLDEVGLCSSPEDSSKLDTSPEELGELNETCNVERVKDFTKSVLLEDDLDDDEQILRARVLTSLAKKPKRTSPFPKVNNPNCYRDPSLPVERKPIPKSHRGLKRQWIRNRPVSPYRHEPVDHKSNKLSSRDINELRAGGNGLKSKATLSKQPVSNTASSSNYYRKKVSVSNSKSFRLSSGISRTTKPLIQVTIPTHGESEQAHKRKALPVPSDQRFVIRLGEDSDSGDDEKSPKRRCVVDASSPSSTPPQVSRSPLMLRWPVRSSSDTETALSPSKPKDLGLKQPSISVDFEKRVELMLKQARLEEEERRGLLKPATPIQKTEKNSSSTPLGIRLLPSSKQEEYKRLKQQLALKEKQRQQHLNKKCDTVVHRSLDKNRIISMSSRSPSSIKINVVNHTTLLRNQMETDERDNKALPIFSVSFKNTGVSTDDSVDDKKLTREVHLTPSERTSSDICKENRASTREVHLNVPSESGSVSETCLLSKENLEKDSATKIISDVSLDNETSIVESKLDVLSESQEKSSETPLLPRVKCEASVENETSMTELHLSASSVGREKMSELQTPLRKDDDLVGPNLINTDLLPIESTTEPNKSVPCENEELPSAKGIVVKCEDTLLKNGLVDILEGNKRQLEISVTKESETNSIAENVDRTESKCMEGMPEVEAALAEDTKGDTSKSVEPTKDPQERLQVAESSLLNERYNVLDELTQMMKQLNQMDRERGVKRDRLSEVRRLRLELARAEECLAHQNQRMRTMHMQITHAHQRMAKGRRQCVALTKACLMLGTQVAGDSYKVPSVGAELMKLKLQQFAAYTRNARLAKKNYGNSSQLNDFNSSSECPSLDTSVSLEGTLPRSPGPESRVNAPSLVDDSNLPASSVTPPALVEEGNCPADVDSQSTVNIDTIAKSDDETVVSEPCLSVNSEVLDSRARETCSSETGEIPESCVSESCSVASGEVPANRVLEPSSSAMADMTECPHLEPFPADDQVGECDVKSSSSVPVDESVGCVTNSNDCEVKEQVSDCLLKREFQEYRSPLEHLRSMRAEGDCDPLAILCPFELRGACRDEDCPYLHQDAR